MVCAIVLLGYVDRLENARAAGLPENHANASSAYGIASPSHKPGDFIVAGFGVQSAFASFITIKTYHARTGDILFEESFDLDVSEDDLPPEEARHALIFAGGIETAGKDPGPFLLRVYDAVTGKFLWEGRLNLNARETPHGGQLTAVLTEDRPAVWRVGAKAEPPIQVSLSLRAVNPRTGQLLWQDRFTPGTSRASGRRAISYHDSDRTMNVASIEHVFDLIVRAFDSKSGRLLWQDSFEETEYIGSIDKYGAPGIKPQIAPWPRSSASRKVMR